MNIGIIVPPSAVPVSAAIMPHRAFRPRIILGNILQPFYPNIRDAERDARSPARHFIWEFPFHMKRLVTFRLIPDCHDVAWHRLVKIAILLLYGWQFIASQCGMTAARHMAARPNARKMVPAPKVGRRAGRKGKCLSTLDGPCALPNMRD
jgi:hypothetical protein